MVRKECRWTGLGPCRIRGRAGIRTAPHQVEAGSSRAAGKASCSGAQAGCRAARFRHEPQRREWIGYEPQQHPDTWPRRQFGGRAVGEKECHAET